MILFKIRELTDPSRLPFREQSSSMLTVRVLFVRSRPWILVLAALTLEMAESWASIWSLYLALVMSATVLLRSPILTFYSLTVISSFSTTYKIRMFKRTLILEYMLQKLSPS